MHTKTHIHIRIAHMHYTYDISCDVCFYKLSKKCDKCPAVHYLIISSVVFDLLDSNFLFLTTGTFEPGFELLPPPNTGSDVTTIDSVKLDVVNFCPSTSLVGAFPDTGVTLPSVEKNQTKNISTIECNRRN